MLKIAERPLGQAAIQVLSELHTGVVAAGDHAAQVEAAKAARKIKTSTKAKETAFKAVRENLAKMSVGSVRCAYCEDSLADEIEHILPKSLFPEYAFLWVNYLFACGPCNGPKSNSYGTVQGDSVVEFIRKKDDPIIAPAAGVHALIDPRTEDPLDFLDLDVGGTTPDGVKINGTFEFLPAYGLGAPQMARAAYTIRVLGLNREVMRVARQNAFGGFRARLREYVEQKAAAAEAAQLSRLQSDLLASPHLTVFAEIRRQRAVLPEISILINDAPEVLAWSLVPAGVAAT